MANKNTNVPNYYSNKSELKRQEKAQINRINKLVTKLEKQGYIVPSIYKGFEPSKFTNVYNSKTKEFKISELEQARNRVDFLKKIRVENIRENSQFLDITTGEILEYTDNKNKIKRLIKNGDFIPVVDTTPKYTNGYFDGNEYHKEGVPVSDIGNAQSYYDSLKELINNMPDAHYVRVSPGRKGWVAVDNTKYKDQFMSMLDELYGAMDDQEFENYIARNYATLEKEIGVVFEDSSGNSVQQSIANATNILNNGIMTAEQREMTAQYSDNNWDEI